MTTTTTASKLAELLHTEIDEQEALRREIRTMVMQIWDESLAELLAIAEGDGQHVGSNVTEALQIFMGRVSVQLNALTAKALQQGAAAGDARVLLGRL